MLEFTLKQGPPSEHNLGRLRLSVTAAKPPLPAPAMPAGLGVVVRGQVPASHSGGTLVVYAQMIKGSDLVKYYGPGKYLFGQGTLAGQTVAWQPVLGTDTFPSSWQAWRTVVGPSAEPRPMELDITTSLLGAGVELKCGSYYLPK